MPESVGYTCLSLAMDRRRVDQLIGARALPWDREDVVSDVILGLLERNRRVPDTRIDVRRTVSWEIANRNRRVLGRDGRKIEMYSLPEDWENQLAVMPDIFVKERLEERFAEEDFEDQLTRESASDRDRRMWKSSQLTHSSPTTPRPATGPVRLGCGVKRKAS